MKTYEEIKKSALENRRNIVLGLGYILVFLLGMGVGRYDLDWQKKLAKMQNNYNTKSINLQKEIATPKVDNPVQKALPAATTTSTATATQPCLIKGNISAQGKKIYHVSGGIYYARTKPEQCFDTEVQAREAGFIKSSR